jgi:hypothetical protein
MMVARYWLDYAAMSVFVWFLAFIIERLRVTAGCNPLSLILRAIK